MEDTIKLIGRFLWSLAYGFVDGGKSTEKALEMLDLELGLYQWVSQATIDMIETEMGFIYVDFDWEKALEYFAEYLDDRRINFMYNGGLTIDIVLLLYKLFFVTVLTATGKFSAMSPIYTAFIPGLMAVNLTVL